MQDHEIGKAIIRNAGDQGAYNRLIQWAQFNDQVMEHILQYTLPQYGNPAGNEQVDEFSVEDCFQNMLRYVNRRKVNLRGNRERLRDLIKIAHYASFAYDKLRAELQEGNVYDVDQ